VRKPLFVPAALLIVLSMVAALCSVPPILAPTEDAEVSEVSPDLVDRTDAQRPDEDPRTIDMPFSLVDGPDAGKPPESAQATEVSFSLVDSPDAPHPAADEIGTAARPIKVLFVPLRDPEVLTAGGQVMARALEATTGLKFEVSVPGSLAATVEAMCASPSDTIGFIPALAYVVARPKCGVEVGAAEVRNGWSVIWGQFLVARDSPYRTLQDLAGKKWMVAGRGSIHSDLYPSVMLKEAGVQPGEVAWTRSYSQAVMAVYNGEADFATTWFVPPIMKPTWKPGDHPEPYDYNAVELNEKGAAYAGTVRVSDARVQALKVAPDVFEKVRIMMLTNPIPYDTVSFGRDFPADLRDTIVAAMVKFGKSKECAESICSSKSYYWAGGVEPTDDSAYDVIRQLITGLGYTEEDILEGK
jgi:phosphonate transport system substrate-binding protein